MWYDGIPHWSLSSNARLKHEMTALIGDRRPFSDWRPPLEDAYPAWRDVAVNTVKFDEGMELTAIVVARGLGAYDEHSGLSGSRCPKHPEQLCFPASQKSILM